MKKLRVTVDGTVFEVTVEVQEEVGQAPAAAPAQTPAPAAAPTPAAAPAPAPVPAGHGPGDIRSPMAGKLVSIDVQVGQTLAEGAQVATVEAMKMNTFVNTHKAGRVASVTSKKPGEPVEEGATLVVLE